MQPTAQKDQPISFLLFDFGERDPLVAWQDLIIRPEEMSRQDPTRLNVTQTLGGAWLDEFGPGVSSLTLSGHTGWRGSASQDGAALFQRLRDVVFVEWNRRRAARPNPASGPKDVELVLADQLNNQAVVVAPQSFQLRRHKSRPLLSSFHISLLVLDELDAVDFVTTQDFIRDAVDAPNRSALARVALADAIRRQKDAQAMLEGSGAGRELVESSRALVDVTNDMLERVNEVAGDFKDGFDTTVAPLMEVSANVLQAGRNAYEILAMPSDVAVYAKYSLMRIASNFGDAYCNLRNGFRRLFDLPDFADLFGASTCSSTGGGRPISPWALDNPFEKIHAPAPTPVIVSARAAAVIPRLQIDPLSSGLSRTEVLGMMRDISSGVKVRA